MFAGPGPRLPIEKTTKPSSEETNRTLNTNLHSSIIPDPEHELALTDTDLLNKIGNELEILIELFRSKDPTKIEDATKINKEVIDEFRQFKEHLPRVQELSELIWETIKKDTPSIKNEDDFKKQINEILTKTVNDTIHHGITITKLTECKELITKYKNSIKTSLTTIPPSTPSVFSILDDKFKFGGGGGVGQGTTNPTFGRGGSLGALLLFLPLVLLLEGLYFTGSYVLDGVYKSISEYMRHRDESEKLFNYIQSERTSWKKHIKKVLPQLLELQNKSAQEIDHVIEKLEGNMEVAEKYPGYKQRYHGFIANYPGDEDSLEYRKIDGNFMKNLAMYTPRNAADTSKFWSAIVNNTQPSKHKYTPSPYKRQTHVNEHEQFYGDLPGVNHTIDYGHPEYDVGHPEYVPPDVIAPDIFDVEKYIDEILKKTNTPKGGKKHHKKHTVRSKKVKRTKHGKSKRKRTKRIQRQT